MFRPLTVYIGLRYTRARKHRFLFSFISAAAMLGIALGVTAIITVLSVMNGFQKEVRDRMLDMIAHVTVTEFSGRLTDWQVLGERIQAEPGVDSVAPYIRAEGMLMNLGEVRGVLVRGVDPEREKKVSKIEQHMEAGSLSDLQAGKFNIVLGRDLARRLGLRVGDRVTLVTPAANVTVAGFAPRLKRFRVSGIFFAGHSTYDNGLALINLGDAQKLFRMKGEVSGLRLKLDDYDQAVNMRVKLSQGLLAGYWVQDWGMVHQNWFRAVQIEKRMMFFLLFIIFVVAATNVISMLVKVVKDKESDIAILRTLGASAGTIRGIFLMQGTLLGFFGTLLGVIGGISLGLNVDSVVKFIEGLMGIKFLDPTVYYVSELPTDLQWPDVWVTAVAAFSICVLATLYPSWRASRVQPVEALRYE
ncbi:MAG TPA: lipoprotein-releasing ABC transporter permease subunit [Gammaproteobacteria bacterium]|nr:lipoprotein-releasing ABC transporter permease subunit [Gammaproteobacteria bacterium]